MVLVLAIEFLDEFVFGAREAAWPQIRDELGLSYVQIGILLSVPGVFSNVIEPFLGILADTRLRKTVMVVSGAAFASAVAMTATADGFIALLAAMVIMYPASGGFVSLAQASYMDADPARRDQNMARWAVAGSVGALAGSVLIGLAITLGAGWRPVMAAGAVLGAVLVFGSLARSGGHAMTSDGMPSGLGTILRDAVRSARSRRVLRWLVLLQTTDLLGDIFLGFLAVYLVDVARAEPWSAAAGVTLWTAAGLAAGVALVPLLGRVDGNSYLRATSLLSLLMIPAFLLIPGVWPKLLAAAALGFIGNGWYPIVQARLYDELPGRSGTAMALTTVFGPIGTFMPFVIGAAAAAFGLHWAMWIVLAAPVSLLLLTPRRHGNGRPGSRLRDIHAPEPAHGEE